MALNDALRDGALSLSRGAAVALSLGCALALWWALSASGWVGADLLPTPPMVWAAARELADEGVLWTDLRVSLTRAAIGFLIGASLGIAVGLCTARLLSANLLLNPILSLLRPVPAIALVPLAIVWFGIGEASKHFVIAYTVFLAVWLSTHHGASSVAGTWIRASRALGASRRREFLEVVVPAAAPHIVAGLRMGAALAFLSLVAAELSGASAGIGYRIQEARQYIRTDRMIVGLVELGVLGASLDALFVRLGRRVVHWESA